MGAGMGRPHHERHLSSRALPDRDAGKLTAERDAFSSGISGILAAPESAERKRGLRARTLVVGAAANSTADHSHGMERAAGARGILVKGRLAAFFRRRNPAIRVFLPAEEPELSDTARQLAQKLAEVAIRYQSRRSGLLISTINDEPAAGHFLARFLEESGFVSTAAGFQMRRIAPSAYSPAVSDESDEDDESDTDA